MTPRTPSMIGTSVLVGVDGSPESRDAAVLGRRLAGAASGSFHLVTAVDDVLLEVASIRSRIDTDRLHERLVEAASRKAVEGLAPDFTPDDAARVLTVRLGRPEHVMAEAARQVAADLLVLGGRRHRAPAAWFHRGTAHHLLRAHTAPMLVTGPTGSDIERVVAAVDLSFASEPTLAVASRLASLLQAPLEALHVLADPRLPAGVDLPLEGRDLAREGEHVDRELLGLLPDGVRRSVVRGDVVSSIRDAVAGAPGLLVLGAQGRGWIDRLLLGSTTESLLSQLPCSLIVVPSSPPSPSTRRRLAPESDRSA